MGRIVLFCALAIALVAMPAFAEVQNIKISGDMAVRYIIRNNYDLDKDNNDDGTGNFLYGNDAHDYITSSTEVQVDADLTDNVSTVVRMINQRDWDDAPTATDTDTTEFDVNIDLAYLTLKEMVYSPLTVRIGRQDIWFGKGFIIGSKIRDHEGNINADEYSVETAFDAIRGTLDLDPWTIDAVYSIIEEDALNSSDDQWLAGCNIGYVFDSYNGEAEAYAWHLRDRSNDSRTGNTAAAVLNEVNWVGTYGIRGSFEPIPNAYIAAEGAVQAGRYETSAIESARSRRGFASDIYGSYHFKDVRWSPKLGLEYIYYSGEEEDAITDSSRWEAWHPMFRGKFDTAIREFQNVYYLTSYRSTNANNITEPQDSGVTNEHQLAIIAKLTPTNTLTVDGRFTWFWFDEEPTANRSQELGEEVDIGLTYDYTEDVSFNLLAAWFFPGKYWMTGQDDTATDIVGSVKVAF
jgi:hypothetical protein